MNNVQKEDRNLENQNTNKFLKIKTFLVFSFWKKKWKEKTWKVNGKNLDGENGMKLKK